MRLLRYVPYDDAADVPNVIVDGAPTHSTVLALSHWPGIPCPPGLEADLSAEMAYRYLDAGAGGHGYAEVVSNNHFDQDGLVGVFALGDPVQAMAQRDLLIDVAAAGDFATYRFRQAARLSMVIAAYTDPERSPLGRQALTGDYPATCGTLYAELLGRLPSLCRELDGHRHLWADEDAELSAAEAAIASGAVSVTEEPELDLAVVAMPDEAPAVGGHRFGHQWAQGLHPMAVHNATACLRIVQVRGRRYELTYRYESWVQYRSRRPLPRVDLAPLADELTAEEHRGARWVFDGVDALTPRLRLATDGDSSLSPERFLAMLRRHLRAAAPAWDPYQTSAR